MLAIGHVMGIQNTVGIVTLYNFTPPHFQLTTVFVSDMAPGRAYSTHMTLCPGLQHKQLLSSSTFTQGVVLGHLHDRVWAYNTRLTVDLGLQHSHDTELRITLFVTLALGLQHSHDSGPEAAFCNTS